MKTDFAIVDLFAGPGGLAEGFSNLRNRDGSRPFRLALSVEKEPSAFETLRLRSFLRQFENGFPQEYYRFLNDNLPEPRWSEIYPQEWEAAERETIMLELGSRDSTEEIDKRLERISKEHRGNVILIGGPQSSCTAAPTPCHALPWSSRGGIEVHLVGRSDNCLACQHLLTPTDLLKNFSVHT